MVIPRVKGQLLSATKENRKNTDQWERIDQICLKAEGKVIAWRRDIHQNPELWNNEFHTSKLIAEPLEKLEIEAKTGVAHTGVFITWPITVGDDFSFYTQQIPRLYFLLGVAPQGENPSKIINHSPFFVVDNNALAHGVEALSHITIEYLGK